MNSRSPGFLYDATVAEHYRAYRPPLHSKILRMALSDDQHRQLGVDVGSGTGQSAQALTDYCTSVTALEPSAAMLLRAPSSPSLSYLQAAGEHMPLMSGVADIVTFAGSLSHLDEELCVSELCRVCRSEALVVVYDFEVQLHSLLIQFGIESAGTPSNYDHRANLCLRDEFGCLFQREESLEFSATSPEVGHLLLSNLNRLNAFRKIASNLDPMDFVLEKFNSAGDLHALTATTYLAVHMLN